ncbi:hypothetical protein DL96DRAFT_266728 [Flagelloscypha sp. PMI_526]|nr:hypothetical protein DL96DRAFT_266728 [Flagelloscypha sp. PMI_526]
MSKPRELPFDIFELLVDFSASSNLDTARALSLVSHECQLRADVYLFRFLFEPEDPMKDCMSNILSKICSDNASPRLTRARQHVRSLSWFEHPQVHQVLYNLGHYLSLLPNLIQLCFRENYIPELGDTDFKFSFDVSHPNLKRILTRSFTAETLPSAKFDYPFWNTITHLQIEPDYPLYQPDSPFAQPLFTNLNHLTHLAIGSPRNLTYEEQPLSRVDTVISRVRSALPPSLILCLLSLELENATDELRRRITSLRLGHIDERIVLWSMPHLLEEYVVPGRSHDKDAFEVWCGIPEGKETFWEAGVAIQSMRI